MANKGCEGCKDEFVDGTFYPCCDCKPQFPHPTHYNRTPIIEPMMKVIDAINLVDSIDFTCSDRAYESVQRVKDELEALYVRNPNE